MHFQVQLSHLKRTLVCPAGLYAGRFPVLALVLLLAFIGFIFSTTRRATSTRAGANVETVNPSSRARAINPALRADLKEAYGKLPLAFEVNQGQAPASVKFSSHGSGYGLYLTQTGAVLALNKPSSRRINQVSSDDKKNSLDADRSVSIEQASTVLRMRLKGANPALQVMGTEELAGKVNYLTGNDRARWQTGVQTFAKVRYEQVYRDVDLVYYGNQQQLEYDFEVAPGGNPGGIKLSFEGMKKLALNEKGDLLLKTKDGDMRWHKPLVYQLIKGERREIAARYSIDKGRREVGFKIASYDHRRPLVIDPTLIYSTYYGGPLTDEGYGIAVDASGSAYITGKTSNIFPTTPDSFQPSIGGDSFFGNAFVTKLNPAGSAVVYSTFLGGINDDIGNGIGVDADGNAHVAGMTCSNDFPVSNAYQPVKAVADFNCDAFLTKLNANGTALLYSTYLGGISTDVARGIALDSAGNAYVVGNTTSTNFPTLNPVQQNKSGHPVFKSTNSGSAWTEASNGLTASLVNTLISDPVNPSTLYAGTEIGVYKSTNAGGIWSSSNNGIPDRDNNITAMLINPNNPSILYATNPNNTCIYKSTDAASNWTSVACYTDGLEIGTLLTLAIDPLNPATLYAGGNGEGYLSKSTDSGQTWHVSNLGMLSSTIIRAIAVDPANSSTVYAGSNFYGVYKSTNGGNTWASKGNGLLGGTILSLAIDPTNTSTIYAGTVQGIYKSTDAGENWFAVNNGLTVSYGSMTLFPQVYAIAIAQTTPQTIYAGGKYGGVFKSIDGGVNWFTVNNGLTNNFIKALAINQATPTTLYAGADSGADVFVAKFSTTGSLLYSTYIGGNEAEIGNGIAVDGSGSVYITGFTVSLNFPTTNPAQSSIQSTSDGFVTKLNSSGSALIYSTYLGGNRDDVGQAIAVDNAGSAYVTGQTSSVNFPTTAGAFDTTCGTDGTCNQNSLGGLIADAFVTKMSASGANFAYSTFIGGSGADIGYGIAVRSDGKAYLTGSTSSRDFPTANPIQAANNSNGSALEVFALRLNETGSSPEFSTYLGGPGSDIGRAITLDSVGSAYLTGSTGPFEFPTVNAVQPAPGGSSRTDAFISKIGEPPPPPVIQFSAASYDVNEADNYATITVQRSGSTANALTVDYATGDGTARQRTDYTLSSGTLTVAPNETSKTFTVLITNNAFVDGTRTVNLTLSNPSEGILGTQAAAVLNILDNDTAQPALNRILCK
jgi:photosystem II stability/assembly factor-like uncharacterized protein